MLYQDADLKIAETAAAFMCQKTTGQASRIVVLRAMSALGWTVTSDGEVFHCWSRRPNPYKDWPNMSENRMWRANCKTAEDCFRIDLLIELEQQFKMGDQKAA